MIKQNAHKYSVSAMCSVLNVNRSSYYYESKPQPIDNSELENDGAAPSKNRVYRLMKKDGIKSKTVKKYKATTNSNHKLSVAENLLNREFTTAKPNQKWVSNITYVATDEGWLYLAGVMDLCGRTIVGFSMDDHMRKSLVIRALNQAIGRTSAKEGLFIHSDRGV